MNTEKVQKWLGLYFLIGSAVIGAYTLVFAETFLLPISRGDSIDVFQIITPVFIAQVTIIFQWYGRGQTPDVSQNIIPSWVVIYPPILSIFVFCLGVIALIIGQNDGGKSWAPSPEQFKMNVTFCVTLLNASTIFVVARYFPQENKVQKES